MAAAMNMPSVTVFCRILCLRNSGPSSAAQPQLVLQTWGIEDLVGAALEDDGGAFGPARQQVLEFASAQHARAAEAKPASSGQRRRGPGKHEGKGLQLHRANRRRGGRLGREIQQ